MDIYVDHAHLQSIFIFLIFGYVFLQHFLILRNLFLSSFFSKRQHFFIFFLYFHGLRFKHFQLHGKFVT